MSELETLLSAAGKVAQIARTAKSNSLVEYTKVARIEPVVPVDHTLITLPYLSDILQVLCSMMGGYYLQAVQLDTTVGDIHVRKLLDKFNPDRGAPSPYLRVLGDGSGVDVGIESAVTLHAGAVANYRLPVSADIQSVGRVNASLEGRQPVVSMEIGFNTATNTFTSVPHVTTDENGEPVSSQTLGKDTIAKLDGSANLAAGLVMDVHLQQGSVKAVIPVTIKLAIAQVDPSIIANVLDSAGTNHTFKERWHGWKAGDLEGIHDMFLCQDMIDEHRRTLMKDTSGIYAEMMRRRQGNRMSALVSGDPSIADASNIWVISETTARSVEGRLGGRLKDFNIRERIFAGSYAMLLVVVDPTYESVTIYTRSIHMPTTISVKELKVASKSKGPDVAEILKAYQLGNAPQF